MFLDPGIQIGLDCLTLCSLYPGRGFWVIFVRNAVNKAISCTKCGNCGETKLFHRISPHFLQKYCKKCGDCDECGEQKQFNTFKRISYKNSPHFLQKFTAFVFQRLHKFTRNMIALSDSWRSGIRS